MLFTCYWLRVFLRAGRAVVRVGFEGVAIAGQMDFRRVANYRSAVAVRVAKVQPHTVSRADKNVSLGNEGGANLRHPRIIVNGHFSCLWVFLPAVAVLGLPWPVPGAGLRFPAH